ncbi:MAG: hypothetical protein KDN22_13350 [Verrucomicrobiae bacterium]|nr:hypothetical protein [Verrucomicrobiae bacterium]
MHPLLVTLIFAEAAFLLVSLWMATHPSPASTTTATALQTDQGHHRDLGKAAEDENFRLRRIWKRIRAADGNAGGSEQHPNAEVSFQAVLGIIHSQFHSAIGSDGAPSVLTRALDLTDDEKAQVDELWRNTRDQLKYLELRHATSANAEIAAESVAHLEESTAIARAKLEAENLTPDEIDAGMEEFTRLMTYNETGNVRVHLDSAALYEEAGPLLQSLHASIQSALSDDSTSASLATEAFADVFLGGRNATATSIDFLFGTDETHIDSTLMANVGTEISPDGQQIPVVSTLQNSFSLPHEEANLRYGHLIDVQNKRLRPAVPGQK